MKKKLIAAGVIVAALVLAPVAGAFAQTVNVGGGLWSYGTTFSDVYSNYHHGSVYHSATACNNGVFQGCSQVAAAAGAWAYASTTKTWTGGNTSYWNTY